MVQLDGRYLNLALANDGGLTRAEKNSAVSSSGTADTASMPYPVRPLWLGLDARGGQLPIV